MLVKTSQILAEARHFLPAVQKNTAAHIENTLTQRKHPAVAGEQTSVVDNHHGALIYGLGQAEIPPNTNGTMIPIDQDSEHPQDSGVGTSCQEHQPRSNTDFASFLIKSYGSHTGSILNQRL